MATVGRKMAGRKVADYQGAEACCRPAPGGVTAGDSNSSDRDGAQFAPRLIAWQLQHGRHELPWQKSRDPYRVWLAEIMLQQTQVTTVIPYYARFLARFPEVAGLAAAPAEEVMALWAGLGYYARARNLHACAQVVVARYDGVFPDTARALAELPGIGRSTAAAIAAFAFGRRGAILDGNVKRVLCRVFAIEGFPGQAVVERCLWALAERLLPDSAIEAYTQGLMDLGATVCTPKRPDCPCCPLAASCRAHLDRRIDELPVARPKKNLPERQLGVLLVHRGDAILLERRPPAGIWGGLWSLPEMRETETAEQAVSRLLGATATCRAVASIRHTFTHFRLDIQPWQCTVDKIGGRTGEPGGHAWVPLAELERFGLPSPIRVLLSR